MRYMSCLIIVFVMTFSLNYAQKSPHGANFKIDCKECHTVNTWKVNLSKMKFDHKSTGFALIGQHQVVQCESCHTSLVFSDAKTKTQCADCHTDVHEKTVGNQCERCHTTKTWVVQNINEIHRMGRFALIGNHQKAACNDCHKSASSLRFEPLSVACVSCHKPDFMATTNPNHVSAGFSQNCEECHDASSPMWATTKVDHSFFPLTAGHAIDNCFACHSQKTFKGLSTDCYSCHQSSYQSAPNHMAQAYPTNCTMCHSITGWQKATFNHAATSFPLTGSHTSVTCASCHTTGFANAKTTPTVCYSCHQSKYTTAPNHVAQSYPQDCAMCHTTTAWQNANFNHATTSFPLTGAHTTVTCATCHTKGFGANATPTACYSCHQSKYTSAPNHVAQAYPTDCAMCHSTTAWQNANFNHATTSFPLTGAHTTVTCATCHTKGFGANATPTTCYSCHQSKYTSAPNHVAQAYPTDCAMCHSTTAWQNANFNHATTSFPLTGAHTTVTCATCHTKGFGANATPTACYSCHQAKYTSAPNHVAQAYPTDCAMCHSTTAWQNANFNHATTSFPLTGAHTTVTCATCHTKGFAAGSTPTTCYGCHQSNFTGTTNPNHVASSFPTDCTLCHSTTNWTSSTFNHATTSFPLTGAHTTVTCNTCHNNNYTGNLPTACYGCHQSDFTGTTNPNHVASAFPTDCTLCHSTNNWTSSTFNHATTSFPLTGAHTTVSCNTCHNGNYSGSLPTDCYGCHKSDFTGTTNPNHVASGFPTTCTTCHSTTNWSSSTFNHATTSFPLTGAHTTVSCNTCHNNNYTGNLPTACYGCHQSDYNGTTNPNHAQAQFPTDCTQCHTTTNWTNSTFNHDAMYFPIYSGNHRNKWTLCSDCHQNPSNFAVHKCNVACHLRDHNQNQDCYKCHPTGQSD